MPRLISQMYSPRNMSCTETRPHLDGVHPTRSAERLRVAEMEGNLTLGGMRNGEAEQLQQTMISRKGARELQCKHAGIILKYRPSPTNANCTCISIILSCRSIAGLKRYPCIACTYPNDCNNSQFAGMLLPTKMNKACSWGMSNRFRTTYKNCPALRSPGTRNLRRGYE